jgi:hypothetical protein
MAKPNVDFKKLMLEKGEKIGLGVAVGFMLLLIIFGLFMPDKGFFSGSPSENARKLKTESTRVKDRMVRAEPDPSLRVVPADVKDIGTAKPLVASAYLAPGDYFADSGVDTTKRLMPEILTPVEYRTAVVLAQEKVNIFNSNDLKTRMILILKGAPPAEGGQKKGNKYYQGGKSGYGGNYTGGSGSGMPKGPGSPGGPGMPGMPGGPGMPGMPSGPGSPGGGMMGSEKGKDYEGHYVPLDNLDNLADGRPADNLRPRRMIEVAGAFPYKKQVEEYARALHHKSLAELFNDPRDIPAFAGINVERRTIGANGKEIAGWIKLDLKGMIVAHNQMSGPRFQEEPPDLEPILQWSTGLVMKLPEQFRDTYPRLDKDLKGITDTLDAMKQRGKDKTISPSKSRYSGDAFDPFGGDTTTDASSGGAPGAPGMPGVPMPPGGKPGSPAGPPGSASEEFFLPDFVLFRFADMTVEAGQTYEYKIQVVMKNPNFGREKECAFSSIAKEDKITSKWAVVSRTAAGADANTPAVAERIHVGSPIEYYAVDEKERGRTNPPADKEKVAMQLHRWFDIVYPNASDRSLAVPVGDWVVAKRVLVHRGEYVGRFDKAEVPVWVWSRDNFVLAYNPKGNVREKRIDVYFGTESGPPEEAILVDFEGGKAAYNRAPAPPGEERKPGADRVDDEASLEVLLLLPDGKLVVRDQNTDKNDEERKARLDAYEKRAKTVKDGGDQGPKKPGGDGLFGPGKNG